jgi:glycosyltransferase involved in cell wall biosynthesis
MVENPLISIIIPVFNREKLIVRTLESIQNQTYSNWECIIVDDGSTDNTLNVIKSFVDEEKRFQIISHHHVGNANILRNIGINMAKGKYVAMLDSDDEFMPHHLSRRLAKIEEWSCDGIYGSYLLFDGLESKKKKAYTPIGNFANYLFSGGVAPTPSHFYTKESISDVMWDEAYKRHQDLDLSIRFSDKYKFYCDEEVTVIVNWEKGVVRNIDFPSCIKFIETYYDQIDQKHLISYSRDMIIFGGSKNLKSVNLKIFIAVLKGNLKDLSFIIRLIYRYPRVMYLWSKFRGDIK